MLPPSFTCFFYYLNQKLLRNSSSTARLVHAERVEKTMLCKDLKVLSIQIHLNVEMKDKIFSDPKAF